ncbi:GNAT family N-acetyltransferase [Paenibacillus assamensis]|uniref:GNAT family N-acetyltransferase n=1 Tax=Paenibacillus assamensis TaxID=311244 RepID=UPI0003F70CAE|nr:GNAT family protein [Paenibacillus assamensis]
MQLTSELLNIRRTELADLAFVIDIESDSTNTPFIGKWTVEQHTTALMDEDVLYVMLEDKQGNPVGYMIITGLLNPNKSVCIERIVVLVKGCGYGKEAMKRMVQWLFEHTDTHRIWLDVKEDNQRARHVYESVRFVYEGTLRDGFFNGEKFESLAIMSILRSEWMNGSSFE